MSEFIVGRYYSFATLAPSVLGGEYKKVKLSAIGDYSLARQFDDIDVKQANIAAFLKADAVAAQDDTYYFFLSDSGSTMIFARNWINLSTLSSSASKRVVVTVEAAGEADARRIRDLLAVSGYSKVTTVVEDI